MNIAGVMRSPKATYFGSGQRFALPQIVKTFGKRALICTDNRFRQDKMLAAIEADLISAGLGVAVYDATIAELPLDCVLEAASQARAFDPDVVIGIGGGSSLDIAKLVALTLRYGDDLSEFYGEFKIPGPVVPIVAVPTTAGTGSEVTPVAVLADPARVSKVGISSPFLIPDVAVCDPELTLTCPPQLTAVAGADALTHAIEAFSAGARPFVPDRALNQVFIGKNSQSDAFARVAIEALIHHLHRAVGEGADRQAREQVMFGALNAGLAFGVAGTAAAHAIQYPIGALTKTAHGLGVAVLLPYVMEYNRPNVVAEFAEIAKVFGVQGDDPETLSFAAIDAAAALFESIGIPKTIAELGVGSDQIGWIAQQSLLSARLVDNNPRPLSQATLTKIIQAAHSGDRASLRFTPERISHAC